VNPGSAQTCDCGYSFVYDEPPRSTSTGDPVARWFGNQRPSDQKRIVRALILGVMVAFALGIAMCSR
jgi:hypothetical protein